MDSFLAIAEELKLKGLTGINSRDLAKEGLTNTKSANKIKENYTKPKFYHIKDFTSSVQFEEASTEAPISNPCNDDLEALDEKVKSMME